MKRALVTGARGFVGAPLIRELTRHDHTVRAISRSAAGEKHAAIEWIDLQIEPGTDWRVSLQDVECVIHLADGLRVFEKAKAAQTADPDACIAATVKLAESAAAANVARFIYVSSLKAAVGEVSHRTLDEAVRPNPTALYGRLKLRCEQELEQTFKDELTELVVIRPPIVYGPGVTNNMARLLRLADSSWPLPFKNLANPRAIVSVSNLASALTAVADFDGDAAGTFYVCDEGCLPIGDIITIFRSALGRPQRLFAVPPAVWPIARTLPGIGPLVTRLSSPLRVSDEKFRRRFGWVQQQKSSSALTNMAQHYHQEHAPFTPIGNAQ